jgi:hypothetical protein
MGTFPHPPIYPSPLKISSLLFNRKKEIFGHIPGFLGVYCPKKGKFELRIEINNVRRSSLTVLNWDRRTTSGQRYLRRTMMAISGLGHTGL